FSPRAAVMEAWATFEATAQAAAIKRQILKPNEPLVFPAIFDKLLNAGFLQPNEVAALVRARELRNRVVHAPGQEIGADTALGCPPLSRFSTQHGATAQPRAARSSIGAKRAV